MRLLLLLILLTIKVVISNAQQLIPKLDWLSNDPKLQLSDAVADVKIDAEGKLWIVTFSEIVRYDSKNYTYIKTDHLNHSSFLKFQETDWNDKYVYDKMGLVYFIRNDSLVPYELNYLIDSVKPGRIVSNYKFLDSAHLELIGSGRVFNFEKEGVNMAPIKLEQKEKVSIFRGDFFLEINCPSCPRVLRHPQHQNPNNSSNSSTFYLLKNSKIIHQIPDRQLTSYTDPSIVKLKDNTYLISTGLGGLYVLDKEKLVEIDFKHSILNLFLDSKRNLWISTRENGVYFIKGFDFTSPDNFILPSSHRMVISAEDHEGGIWGYSESDGVFLVSKPSLRSPLNTEGLSIEKKIEGLYLIDSSIYLSYPNRLVEWNIINQRLNKIILPTNESDVNNDQTIFSMFKPPLLSTIFAGQRGSLLKYDKNKGWKNFISLPQTGNKTVLPIFFKTDSFKWVTASDKTIFYKKENKKINSLSQSINEEIKEIMVINDSIIIMTEKDIYFCKNDCTITISSLDSAFYNNIFDWAYFNNSLWVSTYTKGLYKIELNEITRVDFNSQLINKASFLIEEDSSLWFFNSEYSYNYRVIEGKPNINIYQSLGKFKINHKTSFREKAYIASSKDGLWVTSFDDIRKQNVTLPTLTIDYVRIGSEDFTSKTEKIEVPYDQNFLVIEYNGISYTSNTINYRYRLKGISNQWNNTKEGSVQFTNLDPGKYTFEVKARKGRQEWSEAKFISLTIFSPFWKTWWFLFVIGSTLLLVIYLLYQFKIRALSRERELKISRLSAEQKVLRAKLDPHFIFNIVSSLQYLILKNENKNALQFLKLFSSLMRNTLIQTEMEVINIDDEIKFLKEYIELEKFRLENRFDYSILSDESIPTTINLPSFVIQPFVENAIHHGLKNKVEQGHLTISFSIKRNFLTVIIKDDGIGFKNKKSKHRSVGIKTVERRLKLYNNNRSVVPLKIEEGKDGVKITLKIKI